MSRLYDNEEYEDVPRKTVEIFFDENAAEDDEEQTIQRDEDSEYIDDVCKLLQYLREYNETHALPICQYLNFGILNEFLEK